MPLRQYLLFAAHGVVYGVVLLAYAYACKKIIVRFYSTGSTLDRILAVLSHLSALVTAVPLSVTVELGLRIHDGSQNSASAFILFGVAILSVVATIVVVPLVAPDLRVRK